MEGRTVSHYRITERLGGGGMGVVYKAVDTRLDRPVALKFLPPELTRDEDARLRLIGEAKAASALDHPNICTVHDVDTTPEGQPFIAMSFYDGETLKKRIARGPLSVIEALDVAIQVAQGLAKAHAAGIIHRDIKPANLMVTTDGVVKIVDFGIAKVLDQTGSTQTGTTLGTVSYMSPEQINGESIDARTDVWSLGATLYKMLAGRLPFESDNAMAVMKAIDSRDPVPLHELRADLPDDLVRVVNRALRKSRNDRVASAADLAQQLTTVRNTLTSPVAALVPWRESDWSPRRRSAPWRCRSRGLGWSISRGAAVRAARERIPEITRLADQENTPRPIESRKRSNLCSQTIPSSASCGRVFLSRWTSPPSPAGRACSPGTYVDKTDSWRELGVAPIQGARVPLGMQRFKFVRDGKTRRGSGLSSRGAWRHSPEPDAR